MKKYSWYIFGLFFSLAILVAVGLFFEKVEATDIESGDTQSQIKNLEAQIREKKQKVTEIEKVIEGYKDKIKKTQLQVLSLENQVSILSDKIEQTELHIEATAVTLEGLSLEIEQMTGEINQKESDMERQKKILAELIRELYYENEKKFIEIVAVHHSLSSYYDRMHYLKVVEADLGMSAFNLRITKEQLEFKKEETQKKQKMFTALNQELDEQKKDLEEQVRYKENVLKETEASEAKFKTLVTSLKSQYASIESDIQSREREVRKKYAELERKAAEKTGQKPAEDTGAFSWPVPSRYVTASFHDPDYPYRHIFEHSGIDIRAGQGTAITAAAGGYVARARTCASASCYAYVMIVHANGVSTLYGHMSSISVSEDQFVGRGDVIGYSGGMPGTVGAGPFVTGPHLHFEVRKNGIPVNPMNFF